MNRRVSWVLTALVASVALAVTVFGAGDGEVSREDRLAGEIRCPTCAGLSVAESTSPLADFSEDEIERRVADGESDQQIRDYFVSRYGPEALLSPERSGIGLVAWVGPVVFVVVALLAAVVTLRRWRGRSVPDDEPVEAEPSPPETVSRPASSRSTRRVYVVVAIAVFAVVAVSVAVGSLGEREDSTPEELLIEANAAQAAGEATEALKIYDRVLETDPENATALTYRGWLLRLAGFPDEGFDSLTRALEEDPDFADARLFRGIILFRDRQDAPAAITEIEAFLASSPPDPGRSLGEQVLKDVRNQAGS